MSDALAWFFGFLCEEEPWRDMAACRGKDPALFFPERGSSTREAKETCALCPVKVECDDYAERTGSDYGVWAGKLRNPTKLKVERDFRAGFLPPDDDLPLIADSLGG